MVLFDFSFLRAAALPPGKSIRRLIRSIVPALILGPVHFASADSSQKSIDDTSTLPLKPERKIEFDAHEATWRSLDVSPDGSTIVFDVLGDIFSVETGGGEARLILGGLPFETQPVFSPDGTQIAFISDRSGNQNLWIANADGSNPQRLSTDNDKVTLYTSPAWSPDGQYVFVSRTVHSLLAFEIHMYHVRGGTGIRVTSARPSGNESFDDRINALGATLTPDGQYLYYSTKTGTTWSDRKLPHWSIGG